MSNRIFCHISRYLPPLSCFFLSEIIEQVSGIKLINDCSYQKAFAGFKIILLSLHQYFAKRRILLHETIWFVSFTSYENKFDA